jgi:hypothetical protein
MKLCTARTDIYQKRDMYRLKKTMFKLVESHPNHKEIHEASTIACILWFGCILVKIDIARLSSATCTTAAGVWSASTPCCCQDVFDGYLLSCKTDSSHKQLI